MSPVSSVVLIATHWCNYRCAHCYDGITHTREPSRADVFQVLDRLADQGVRTVELSGGEVTLLANLEAVVTQCKALGMTVRVFTNGSMRTWPMRLVDGASVSLDGTRHSHNAMRGRPFAYDRAVKTLSTLDALQVPTHLQMSVADDNVSDILTVSRIARTYRCVSSMHVAGILPLGAAQGPNAPRLSASNFPKLLAQLDSVLIESGHDLTLTTNIARHAALRAYRDSASRLRVPVVVDATRDSVHLLTQASDPVCSASRFDPVLVAARTEALQYRVARWQNDDLPDVANVEQMLVNEVRAGDSTRFRSDSEGR